MAEKVLPYCSSLIVCDFVHKDGLSQKHSMIGTFDRVLPEVTPTQRIPLGIYAALAGGRGVCDLLIQLIHSKDYDSDIDPLFKINVSQIAFSNPLTPIEMGFNLQFAFPREGVYFLQLYADGQLLLEKSIAVILKPKE